MGHLLTAGGVQAEVKALETGVEIGASTKRAMTATGVMFPLTDDGWDALQALKAGKVNYVQLQLDIATEQISRVAVQPCPPLLATRPPTFQPRGSRGRRKR